jgi:hypothetical protein
MTGRRRTRPAAGLLAGLLTVALVAGCGGARTPSVPDDAKEHTAVSPRQAVMILGAVDAALVRAATARSADAAGGRAVGPAKEGLTARIRVQAALKQAPVPPSAPTKPRLLLTRTEGWPRWFLAAGATPASATPVLRVLHSADARAPYGLWAQLQLLPGAALPDMASATVGSVPLAADAPGQQQPPTQVLTRYTELLNRGEVSAYRADFAPDAYRAELAQQLAADRKLFVTAKAGQVTALHKWAPVGPFALPTRDGGALVIGRIDQRYSVVVAPGRRAVRLDPELAALAARQVVTKKLDRWSVEVLAFYVPKAGSPAKITLIAASRTDVAAAGA